MCGTPMEQRSAGPRESLLCDGIGAKNANNSFSLREERQFAGSPGQSRVLGGTKTGEGGGHQMVQSTFDVVVGGWVGNADRFNARSDVVDTSKVAQGQHEHETMGGT